MGYNIWRSASESAANKFNSKSKVALDIRKLLRAVISDPKISENTQSIRLISMTGENIWRRANRQCYFVEDMKLLDFIKNAKFEIQFDNLQLPARGFTVAFPKKSGLQGIMISYSPNVIADSQEFAAWLGLDEIQFDPSCVKVEPQVMVSSNGVCGSFGSNSLNETLDDENLCDSIAIRPSKEMELPQDRATEFRGIIKLALRFVAYMNAFPEMVRPGLPDGLPQREIKRMPQRNVHTIKMHERVKSSPKAHYRSFHFRHLRHERYKRDANGNVRIVMVKASIVGEKIDPYTVTAKDGVQ